MQHVILVSNQIKSDINQMAYEIQVLEAKRRMLIDYGWNLENAIEKDKELSGLGKHID